MSHPLTRLAVLLLIPVLTSCSAPAGRGAREQMFGSWELQSRTVTRANGEAIADPVLGAQPIGRLFYDASGHMALQMMRQGRPQAITEPANPEDAKNARVVLGYDAYFGTFTVDEAAGTVTHHVAELAVSRGPRQGFHAQLPRERRHLRVEFHLARRGWWRDHAHAGVPPIEVSR